MLVNWKSRAADKGSRIGGEREDAKDMSGPANIVLVRHGQTAWNRERRFRGRKDLPLSDLGLDQARALADALGGENIAALYRSPLLRCEQTLAPLAGRLGIGSAAAEDLIDMDFGAIEGMEVEAAKREYPELMKKWVEAPEEVVFPGGEGLAGVSSRAVRAIGDIASRHKGETVAVCAHRVINKLALLNLAGAGPEGFWVFFQAAACVNRFSIDPPRAVIFSVNDVSHLASLDGRSRVDF